ncbi:MAG TPA: DUF1990 domain-containing protein [Candidatus Sulfotelmatobacter sp.]|nr:DUF1990 domain-containing protein [Candidatus Sulfotelmatobacter sp.]
MFLLTAPSEDEIRRFISAQQKSRFSYAEVGATASGAPNGYNVDHNRVDLGSGEIAWHRAVEAVREWRMFDMPWLRPCWPTAPIRIGTDVALLVRHFGFVSLNACRIVYVVDESASIKRFGFAYGTLEEHAESGEERFTVEWNQVSNKVCHDILAFSRPRSALARLGYPLSRFLQKQFVEHSKAAMLRFLAG